MDALGLVSDQQVCNRNTHLHENFPFVSHQSYRELKKIPKVCSSFSQLNAQTICQEDLGSYYIEASNQIPWAHGAYQLAA